jgi:hypothetical protein
VLARWRRVGRRREAIVRLARIGLGGSGYEPIPFGGNPFLLGLALRGARLCHAEGTLERGFGHRALSRTPGSYEDGLDRSSVPFDRTHA